MPTCIYRVTHISDHFSKYALYSSRKQFCCVFIEARNIAYSFFQHLKQSNQAILVCTLFVANNISTNKGNSDLLQAAKVTLVEIRGLCCHGNVGSDTGRDPQSKIVKIQEDFSA